MASLRLRRRQFRVMSLALIGWGVGGQAVERHVEHLAEGRSLKPFTTVRIGKTCWSFSLVYEAPAKGVDHFTWTETWRLALPKGAK
jgi:hypothetical protein